MAATKDRVNCDVNEKLFFSGKQLEDRPGRTVGLQYPKGVYIMRLGARREERFMRW
jgi:hypothetical protein